MAASRKAAAVRNALFQYAFYFIMKETQPSKSEVAIHNFRISHLTLKGSQVAQVSLKRTLFTESQPTGRRSSPGSPVRSPST